MGLRRGGGEGGGVADLDLDLDLESRSSGPLLLSVQGGGVVECSR